MSSIGEKLRAGLGGENEVRKWTVDGVVEELRRAGFDTWAER